MHPACAAAVLGDDPELVALAAVADRDPADLAGDAAPGLQDRQPVGVDADKEEHPEQRVEQVHLAFLAQAAVAPELSDASEGAAQRLQEPLATRIAHLVRTGDLPAHLDAENAAARLRVLLDGLRVQLVTTPRQTTREWALSVLDDYLAALATPSAEAAIPAAVDSREG